MFDVSENGICLIKKLMYILIIYCSKCYFLNWFVKMRERYKKMWSTCVLAVGSSPVVVLWVSNIHPVTIWKFYSQDEHRHHFNTSHECPTLILWWSRKDVLWTDIGVRLWSPLDLIRTNVGYYRRPQDEGSSRIWRFLDILWMSLCCMGYNSLR